MSIPVQVVFRNTSPSDILEMLVRKLAAKLERFHDRVNSCRVIVERRQRATSSHLYHVRVEVSVPPGTELVVDHEPTLHGTLRDLEVEKTRREADAALVAKNPQRAIREAFRERRRRLQDFARQQEGSVKRLRKQSVGRVREIFPAAGYGFVENHDGRQVFFHENAVLNGHFNRLRAGTKVRFVEEAGEKGPQASTVRVAHARKQGRKAALTVAVPRRAKASRSASSKAPQRKVAR